MDATLALLLAQDGLVTGAIYALLATAIVLVFSVTRVPFVPLGGFVTYTALSLVSIQDGVTPLALWVVLILGLGCFLFDMVELYRRHLSSAVLWRRVAASTFRWIIGPGVVSVAAIAVAHTHSPIPLTMLVSMLLVVPMGPMIYRLVFQPLKGNDSLTFFMLAIAADVSMVAVALLLFGPEGARTASYADFQLHLGAQLVPGQNALILATSLVLTVALWLFFKRTMRGKMLRATAVNRIGAQLVGIDTVRSGRLAFTLAAVIGSACGALIGARVTLSYSSGVIIGLKGFIAAVMGGFLSYPLAALGAVLIGLLESFSSFWLSAWKEVIVFTIIIPVLLLRMLFSGSGDEH